MPVTRRGFLLYSLGAGLVCSTGGTSSFAGSSRGESLSIMKKYPIVDAHAHLFTSRDVLEWHETGMVASGFAAIGDRVYLNRRKSGTPYDDTVDQLESILALSKAGLIKPVLKSSDIPDSVDKRQIPGAILSIEGGDALMGKADLVNRFRDMGVRIITIVHYTVNDLGDIMTAPPKHNGLTEAGKAVVERMQKAGVVVDVAHAHPETMKQVVAVAVKPVIDSHTSLCYDETRCGRRRTWKEMELIAGTDGLVCTWPLSYDRRKTFQDWAVELLEMKKRLGIRHIGLGTDDGGRLPSMVSGYHDTRDLGLLIKAMGDAGFGRDDITAFLGGNITRVLKECMG